MVIRLQVRHDTKANWEAQNPVLAVGEIGIETDNPNGTKIKVGDGNKNWTSLPYTDENAVHKKNDETIGGMKVFSDGATFSSGIFIPSGKMLNGLASNALYDSENNQIDTYYQKSLSNKVAVADTDDWNDFTEEGYYKVDIADFGSYLDKHTPNQFKFDMNPTGILLVFHNDNIITQMYLPYINSPIVYRSYNGTSWTDWLSIIAEDTTVIHTEGDETINGIKTFNDNMILGAPVADQAQCVRYLLHNNPHPLLNVSPEELVAYYYEEGRLEGVRPDIAFAQALKETGYFSFGGTVVPAQNNYCGLGTTSRSVRGAYFDSPRLGVRAHIQHLLAYSSTALPKADIVDPRYDLVRSTYGTSTLNQWQDLNGRWAVPGVGYGQSILDYYRGILNS